ncbi:hypothetical protein K2173_011244 [Erythroxylum novogranatense]|uniref:Rieske domain-containing protein n=1 Tax=Erythroxylum novogranatense TaxID=1862640 RepID=A0AAV8TVR0_9ROSI|nr:hypothetical protein K2173_011244 [Erythroxylum novogranatense]
MGALKVSFFPSLNSSVHSKLCRTHIQHLHYCPISSTQLVQSIPSNLSRSKLFNTFSSASVATEPDGLTEPVLEDESQGDKFDWFAQWYPLMPVCDLDKRVPHAKRVMGLDVVVWWDRNDNSWKVLNDACPHRLAPLSEGRIDQWGRLQCVYHGWCFGGSGDCKFIPQAPPDGPPVHTFKKACVESYPSTVQNGILWFWPNSGTQYKDILSTKSPPYIAVLDDPSYTKSMANRDFPFGYEILIENLMDPAHVPYAHYKLLPSLPSKNSVKHDREGGSPLDIDIHRWDITGYSATRDGNANTEFIAPCVFCSVSTLPNAKDSLAEKGNGSASSEGNEEGQQSSSQMSQRQAVLIFICVPVGPGKSRLIYSFPRNFAVWLDRIIPRWVYHLQQNLVLDSDLYLLHLQEHKILDVGPSNWQKACFVPTKSDAQVVAFRRWLKKYSGGQIHWEGKLSEALPPTPPKEELMDRYWSHVVNCSSCSVAYKVLNTLEAILPVISIGVLGIVAAAKPPGAIPAAAKTTLVLVAVLFFAASRWLTHFIYKNFHFHDYSHALL